VPFVSPLVVLYNKNIFLTIGKRLVMLMKKTRRESARYKRDRQQYSPMYLKLLSLSLFSSSSLSLPRDFLTYGSSGNAHLVEESHISHPRGDVRRAISLLRADRLFGWGKSIGKGEFKARGRVHMTTGH